MIESTVPGSVMLLGEHAVLQGYPAVVSAVNFYMTVKLSPRTDDQVTIESALGQATLRLSQVEIKPPFRFVLAAIHYYQAKLQTGFDLNIQSDFSHQVGLGSSAAVTVAMVRVLRSYLNLPTTELLVYHDALQVMRQVQGMGSGADIAASVFGGVLSYSIDPLTIETLPSVPNLNLFYSGSKTPTPEVLEYVKTLFANKPKELNHIYQKIGECAKQGIAAIKNKNWHELGLCFIAQQQWMTALGVTNQALQNLIDKLSQEKKIAGVKISGAGLGDCVIALGDLNQTSWVKEINYIRVC